ncbi:type II toxin-antitoxin system prevent-host-death family antitoxin [Streptosporangium longisporum]|uniref:Antitoxin n=1 Tax=Streptosporangium longisporum TaxID=46187 RepID=A0ABP6L191_9ACTN
MTFREMGVEESRKRLGDLVEWAQQGRTVTITRRGRPAATLGPVPLHVALRDITVAALDQDEWRDQAIDDWMEAAAEYGHGFIVLATYDTGDVIAVLAIEKWVGDQVMAGERLTLRFRRGNEEVAEGDGDMLDIHPGPYNPAQHPVQAGPFNPQEPAVEGRFKVRLNGSGGIRLDWGGGEIDMDAAEADGLSAALAQAAADQRRTAG